jgi:hypothetical protein
LSRSYRGETGILETRFETPEGTAKVVDFMALSQEGEDQVDLIRLVYGENGRVRMRTEIVLRFSITRYSRKFATEPLSVITRWTTGRRDEQSAHGE